MKEAHSSKAMLHPLQQLHRSEVHASHHYGATAWLPRCAHDTCRQFWLCMWPSKRYCNNACNSLCTHIDRWLASVKAT